MAFWESAAVKLCAEVCFVAFLLQFYSCVLQLWRSEVCDRFIETDVSRN